MENASAGRRSFFQGHTAHKEQDDEVGNGERIMNESQPHWLLDTSTILWVADKNLT